MLFSSWFQNDIYHAHFSLLESLKKPCLVCQVLQEWDEQILQFRIVINQSDCIDEVFVDLAIGEVMPHGNPLAVVPCALDGEAKRFLIRKEMRSGQSLKAESSFETKFRQSTLDRQFFVAISAGAPRSLI